MQQLDVNALVRSIIQRIAVGPDRGRDISEDEAFQMMQAVLNGQVDPVQTAVILIALRMKRESVEEYHGIFRALQFEVDVVQAAVDELYCLADPFDGYVRNLSMTPFIPAVLAANGYATVMTGVESVGPKFGVTAHQVLSAAGIATSLSSAAAAECVAEKGWAYLDQSKYAPKLFALQSLRDRIVKRSALTTLERPMMPLRARKNTHLVLGYVHKAYPEIYTAVAKSAGFSSALLLKGVEGGLAPAVNKPLRQLFRDFRSPSPTAVSTNSELPASIVGKTAAAAAPAEMTQAVTATLNLGLQVLNGVEGVARSSLVAATSQVLFAHDETVSLGEVVEKVQRSLDNESALEKFNAHRAL